MTGDQFKVGFALALVYAVPGATMEELSAFLGSSYPEQVRAHVQGALPGRIAALRARIAGRIKQAHASAGCGAATDLQRDRQLLAELRATQKVVEDALCAEFVERALHIVDRSDVPGGQGGAVLVRNVDEVIARLRAGVVLGASNDPDAERVHTVPAMRALFRRHALMPLPGGHACCTFRSGRDDPASAECLVRAAAARPPWATASNVPQGGRPDYAHSGVLPCIGRRISADGDRARLGCAHAAVFNGNRAVVARVGDRLAADAARAPTSGSKALAEKLVADVMAAMEASKPPTKG